MTDVTATEPAWADDDVTVWTTSGSATVMPPVPHFVLAPPEPNRPTTDDPGGDT